MAPETWSWSIISCLLRVSSNKRPFCSFTICVYPRVQCVCVCVCVCNVCGAYVHNQQGLTHQHSYCLPSSPHHISPFPSGSGTHSQQSALTQARWLSVPSAVRPLKSPCTSPLHSSMSCSPCRAARSCQGSQYTLTSTHRRMRAHMTHTQTCEHT